MKLLLATILLASTTAAADPCAVRIVRATDEVRAEIERWVAAEPACKRALDVRVVPTDNGLYLLANGADGVVHERIVPDAQAAGVLVASWVAADAPATPAQVVAPGVVVRAMPTPIESVAATAEPPRGTWYTVGVAAVGQLSKGYALRGELTIGRRGWLAYGAGSIGRTPLAYNFDSSGSTIDLYPLDTRVAIGAGHQWGQRATQIGLRAGLQLAWWSGTFSTGSAGPDRVATSFRGLEGSLFVNHQVGRQWWFIGGLDVATFTSQDQMSQFVDEIIVSGPAFEIGIHGGLAVRL